jgi:alcohol dehydrogenase (cytochrome c)
VQGATNWYSPSFSPRTGLFYIPTWVNYSSVFNKYPIQYQAGQRFTGGAPVNVVPGTRGVTPINTRREEDGHGAVRAMDPATGNLKWEFAMTDVTDSGILTTSSDLLFVGNRDGYFYALNARTGAVVWRATVGGQVVAGPMSYQVGNKQYVAIAAGSALFTFALP